MLLIAALVAVLTLVLAKPAQGDPAFDYALGINSAELDDAELERTLNAAKTAGANAVDSGAVWWYLETSPHSYDWSSLDRLVDGAEARGMQVRLQLLGTPDRVHPDIVNTVPAHSDRVWYPPRGDTELGHWSNFVYDMVSRYGGRVARYEMWNEPNPEEYAALLHAGYLSAKSAYPEGAVAFGGLSRNDVGYLNAFYSEPKKYPDAADNAYFFDVMDVHPYSSIRSTTADGLQEPLSPDAYTPDAVFNGAYGEIDQSFLGVKKIKSVMDEQGDTGKFVYLGEYGFSTVDTWMRAVPDSRRALYLKRAYFLARDLPYVEGMRWFAYHPTDSTGPEWTILNAGLNETMTFRALEQTTGSESGGASVALSTPSTCSISGTYSVSPTAANLEPTSGWEFYVDGAYQGTYSQVPFDRDTTNVIDGTHTLMVAAYTQEGSVWPSDVVSVKVNNNREAPLCVRGTVTINGGAARTRHRTVNLTLSASNPEPGTGVASMRFSNSGTTWSAWEPYATSKRWILSRGYGTKIVHV